MGRERGNICGICWNVNLWDALQRRYRRRSVGRCAGSSLFPGSSYKVDDTMSERMDRRYAGVIRAERLEHARCHACIFVVRDGHICSYRRLTWTFSKQIANANRSVIPRPPALQLVQPSQPLSLLHRPILLRQWTRVQVRIFCAERILSATVTT